MDDAGTSGFRRHIWTGLVAAGALAFWIVGVGAGLRGWLLLDDVDPTRGLVAHAQAFGTEAAVWWVPAAILTVGAIITAFGVAFLHRLDSTASATAQEAPVEELDTAERV